MDLVLTVVRDDDEVVGATAELVGVPSFLEPQELPRKSPLTLGSHNLGTFGGAVGRGVIRRGEDVLVKISVG